MRIFYVSTKRMIKQTCFIILLCVCLLFSFATAQAQSTSKIKSMLQQEFISANFLGPYQSNVNSEKFNAEVHMDSIFTAFQKAWKQAAPDTLKKYKLDISLEQFSNIDAYCYLWALSSYAKDLRMSTTIKNKLVKNYMISALNNDLQSLSKHKNLSSLKLIYAANLQNTLALGTQADVDTNTFLSVITLFNDFDQVLKGIATQPDPAMSNYAIAQLKTMERFRYDINTRNAYYKHQPTVAFKIILQGLLNSLYPVSSAYATSKLLLKDYQNTADTSRAHQLLKALMLNTSTDVVPKEELRDWYQKLDGKNGEEQYRQISAKISGSFQAGSYNIKLPKPWKFLANTVPEEMINKVKYYFVDVWYTGCFPCIDEIPALNAFYNKIKDREDIRLISINTDYKNGKRNELDVIERSKDLKIAFPIVYDHGKLNLSTQLKVTGYPSKFIVDSNGKVIVKFDQTAISLKTFDLFIDELDNGKLKVNR
ncbi:MAG: TlpA disulfide reductase family protein [Pedobacter sp.]